MTCCFCFMHGDKQEGEQSVALRLSDWCLGEVQHADGGGGSGCGPPPAAHLYTSFESVFLRNVSVTPTWRQVDQPHWQDGKTCVVMFDFLSESCWKSHFLSDWHTQSRGADQCDVAYRKGGVVCRMLFWLRTMADGCMWVCSHAHVCGCMCASVCAFVGTVSSTLGWMSCWNSSGWLQEGTASSILHHTKRCVRKDLEASNLPV